MPARRSGVAAVAPPLGEGVRAVGHRRAAKIANQGPFPRVFTIGDVEDDTYEIVGIHDGPPRVVYKDALREYFLYKPDPPESRIEYDDEGRPSHLRGISDQEREAKQENPMSAVTSGRGRRPSSRTPAGGKRTLSQAIEAIPEERRGALGDKANEELNRALDAAKAAEAQDQNARNNNKNNKNNNKGNRANNKGNNRNNNKANNRGGRSNNPKANPRGNKNNNNKNNRTNNNNNRRDTPRSPSPGNRARSGGTSTRATMENQRQPGRALSGQRRTHRTEAEKAETARIQEMSDDEREAYEEEQQRMAEEDQERDN